MSPRQATPLLVVLSLLAAAAIGYFGFFYGGDDESDGSMERDATTEEVAQGSAPDTELQAAADAERTDEELMPHEATDERVDVALEEERAEEAAMQFVSGSVQLGFDVPADEKLFVMSIDRFRSAQGLYGKSGLSGAVWDTELERHGLHDFSAVEADGSFRVGVPAEANVAHLALAGRYVYSKRSISAALGEGADEVVVTGELGSWITGILTAPRSLDEPISLEGVELELGVDITAGFNAMEIASEAYEAGAETDAEGLFEFRAVSNALTHGMLVQHDELAANLMLGLRPNPGEHLELKVRMQVGATLRGQVLDEAGNGIAGAEVTATLRGTLGDAIGELRTTETDEAGVYELKNVITGNQIEVNASLEGMRPDTLKLEEKLRDGQLLEDLRLVLSEGETIAGRVLYPDGQPAAESLVFLTGDLARTDVAMMGARVAAMRNSKAETDAQGHFEVRGLEEGPYKLTVSVENEEGDHAGSWRASEGNVMGGTSELTLELEGLTPVAGWVTTASEKQIEEFTVHMTLKGSGGMMGIGSERLRESFENSGDGSFHKEDVPPGLWEVTVQATGFARSETVEVMVPQGGGVPLPEFALVPAAGVAGTVYDSFNKPVSGAKVALEMELADRINNAFTGEAPSTFSDHEGKYLLSQLNPGSHTVVATLEGFAGSEPQAVELAPGETVEDIDHRLRVGGTLNGQVLDDDGEPAVGRMIIVQRVPTYASQYMNSSDANGEFQFEHLEPGSWQVVSTPNFMTGELDVAGGDDIGDLLGDLKMDMVDIVDGEETFVLLGKPPEDPIEILGSVSHDGGPIVDAIVSFVPEGMEGLGDLKMSTTNEDGNFTLTLDKRGTYLVTVQNSVSTGRQNSIEFQERIPEDGETHRLALELPRAGITGRVIGPDGRPAADCRVTLTVDGGIAYGSFLGGHYTEIVTGDDGKYEINFLHEGTYTVSAGGATLSGLFGDDSSGGRQVRDGIEVGEDQWVTGIDFKLQEPGSLGGKVHGIDSLAVAGAAVFVRDSNGRLLERFSMVTTDAGGKFEYHGVSAGEYTISAKKDGFVSNNSELVSVKAGQTAAIDVQLEDGTVFLVSVIDKNGDEIRARISVKDDSGNEMCGMLSLDEIMQSFGQGFSSKEQRVGPLPAGKYRVEATLDDGRTTKKNVRASGQSERKIKLRL